MKPRAQTQQLGLAIDLGPARGPRCKLCGAKAEPRCRWCDKGEWPAPGTKGSAQWTRGLSRTVIARLEGAGFPPAVAMRAWSAMLFDEPLPEGTEALLADVLRFPLSARRWWATIDAGVAGSLAYDALRKVGFDHAEAEKLSRARAREVYERKMAGRVRISVEGLRVAAPAGELEAAGELAAEAEALAEEEGEGSFRGAETTFRGQRLTDQRGNT